MKKINLGVIIFGIIFILTLVFGRLIGESNVLIGVVLMYGSVLGVLFSLFFSKSKEPEEILSGPVSKSKRFIKIILVIIILALVFWFFYYILNGIPLLLKMTTGA